MDSYYPVPKALDLYCGEGGASWGLFRAGFDVTGVDIKQMDRYPCRFVKGDALAYPTDGFDFIWASPPCQPFTVLGGREDLSKYEDLIEPTRAKLIASGKPWVMENVCGAPLRNDLTLCANYFGLRSYRHRIFECSFPVEQPPHPKHAVRVNRRGENRKQHWANGGHMTITGDVGVYVGPEAMGINWMSGNGLSQAIPPAYSEYIARQFLIANTLVRCSAPSDDCEHIGKEKAYAMSENPVKELIIGLRGTEFPRKCDWCAKEITEETAEPEEAGQWVCYECATSEPT